MLRDVTVTKGPEPKVVRLNVRWQGGDTETLKIELPQKRADAMRYPMSLVARIRQLARDHHDDEIVALLRGEGQKNSTTGRPITLGAIKWIRYKHHIPAPPRPDGTLNVRQIRERYGVSLWVVHYWIERGSPRHNASQMRHMPLRSMTNWIDASENGSSTQPIFVRHPQR